MVPRKLLRLLNAVIALSFLGLLVVYMQSPYNNKLVDEQRSDAIAFDTYYSTNTNNNNNNNNNNNDNNHLLLTDLIDTIDENKDDHYAGIPSPLSQDDIIASIEFLNANYEVLNAHQFGPVQYAKFVIVVQVHNRIEYLKYLIESLEKSKYIDEVLLIFSHDYSSSSINQLVKQIKFCRVIQIFYPYNIQLFPNIYPGQHPRDCPEGISIEEAKAMKCNNWAYPDKYGHYRVAKITQIKHHWWWKINYVFDNIMVRYDLSNVWVVLLEEDHYVAPDFIHVLKMIIQHKKEFCESCELISLGFYLKQYRSYEDDIASLGVHPWFSSKHNMGMAFNTPTWKLIKNCSKAFCTYDDYNWDWSLMHISVKCLPTKLKVISLKSPRVLHIGDCGIHTHRCNVQNALKKAQDLFVRVSERLFPTSLRVVENSRRMLKPSKENGGWADIRDHQLCFNNSHIYFNNNINNNFNINYNYNNAAANVLGFDSNFSNNNFSHSSSFIFPF